MAAAIGCGVCAFFLEASTVRFDPATRTLTFVRKPMYRICCPVNMTIPFDQLAHAMDDGFSTGAARNVANDAFVRTYSILLQQPGKALRMCALTGTRPEAAAAVAQWNLYLTFLRGRYAAGAIAAAPAIPVAHSV